MNAITIRRSLILLMVLFLGSVATAAWMLSRPIRPINSTVEQFRFADISNPALPDFHLTDFNGQPRTLSDYRGRVVVMFFGFTRCPNVCPTELFTLAQVMKRLGSKSDRVQVLFITLDPERDTPEVLRSYLAAFDPRFIGLTGTPEQTESAAKSYHVVHFKEAIGNDYTIDHSDATYVIDAQRKHRLVGAVDASAEDFVHDLRLLIK
jgi:protein SCO1